MKSLRYKEHPSNAPMEKSGIDGLSKIGFDCHTDRIRGRGSVIIVPYKGNISQDVHTIISDIGPHSVYIVFMFCESVFM